ncbi:MAG: hypothetical protein LBR67_04515 [Dysgonamonadaceae bacterium]|jgi:hypothetical protein|nr:hypothetical protein [Dysgonamonadaceae bacterium]
MKKIYIKTVLLVAIAASLATCYDDKGSYDYHDINEGTVSGLDSSYTVIYKADTLHITPQWTFTQDNGDPDRYRYEWTLTPAKNDTSLSKHIIGASHDLAYFPDAKPGDYNLWTKATDKETGVQWMGKSVPFSIRTQFGLGMMVMGEDAEGYADIEMISVSSDTVILRKLLRNSGLPPLRNPIRVYYSGKQSLASFDIYAELWAMTGDGSYQLDSKTFDGNIENTFDKHLLACLPMPGDAKPILFAKYPLKLISMNRIAICDNGDLFHQPVLSSSNGFYMTQVNVPFIGSAERFPVAPYVWQSTVLTAGYIVYDQSGRRFIKVEMSGGSNVASLPDNVTDKFPWVQPAGRTLIYGENSSKNFALMKDDNYHIYTFATTSAFTKSNYYTIDLSIAYRLPDAKLYAFSAQRTFLLYAVGSTLYAYDYDPANPRLFSIDMVDEITAMEFELSQDKTGNTLTVCTYNPTTKGTLTSYALSLDPNKFELVPLFSRSDLVKIVDVEWRIGEN